MKASDRRKHLAALATEWRGLVRARIDRECERAAAVRRLATINRRLRQIEREQAALRDP